ncbi:MAG: hypothetical protein M3072_17965 [Candidatus Dormibacteraeota bacterium]|nr:hypothetical protein [Candidatus Dormibacteraeota bacterium]
MDDSHAASVGGRDPAQEGFQRRPFHLSRRGGQIFLCRRAVSGVQQPQLETAGAGVDDEYADAGAQ